MSFKIGVDVGGTFTDVCMFNEQNGEVMVHKLPSTPSDPSKAIRDGIEQILDLNGVSPEAVTYLAHGTTVATNAAIERKGSKTALITTKGFRDLIELARQQRASLYDVQVDKPVPIIEKHLRREVNERLMADGSILIPLDVEEVKALVDELKGMGVESYAVCLIHSYKNPIHEQMIKQIIQKRHPEAYISISYEVLPEYREYERTTTTALNSYIGPKIGTYATYFKQKVKEMGMKLTPYINQSNGGLMSIEKTFESPIRTALSGPAAGVSGANYIAKTVGIKNFITFDMGGTSTDVCLIENNDPKLTTSKGVADFPVKVPMVDVTAVGAGGGSIAWIDSGGMLKMGPESAGAYPGPIAYMRGGTIPTVTDANVVLHRLNPKTILGGRMKVDEKAAYDAIEEQIGKPLGMSALDAARGMITVVNSNMSRAIRVVSVERGYDPRNFVLVPFGGAGALHAATVAKEMGIRKLLIPNNPGILCAVGLLSSDIRSDYVKTDIAKVIDENADQIKANFEELVSQGNEWLAQEGIPEKDRVIKCHADLRYYGQNYELSVDISKDDLGADCIETLRAGFNAAHAREYGYCNEKAVVQVVNFRVTAIGEVSKIGFKKYPYVGENAEKAIIETRPVFFEENKGYVETKIYDRSLLETGNKISGPAIIEQMDSTTVVTPSYTATVDEYHNLVLEMND